MLHTVPHIAILKALIKILLYTSKDFDPVYGPLAAISFAGAHLFFRAAKQHDEDIN